MQVPGQHDGGSGTGWTNTGNIVADDGNAASVSLGNNGSSENLIAPVLILSIPTNATITGIAVILIAGVHATNSFRMLRCQSSKSWFTSAGDNKANTGTMAYKYCLQ